MDKHIDAIVRAVEDYPPLAPEEHLWLEQVLGRKLTTAEAQEALKTAKLVASWEWEHAKRAARGA